MGRLGPLKRYVSPERAVLASLPKGLVRRRPRLFAEWNALRKWGRLPPWEIEPVGYALRLARERAGLTQTELAQRLGCSQQAVAQAERWEGNPTVDFIRRWADACESKMKIQLVSTARARGVLAPSRRGRTSTVRRAGARTL